MIPDWSEDRLRQALSVTAGPTSDYDLNPDVAPPAGNLRPAGVLAAFHQDNGRLVLTKRASGLRHHPGQIASLLDSQNRCITASGSARLQTPA